MDAALVQDRTAGTREAGSDLFAPDFSEQPFWHRDLPPAPALSRALPERADVVVIGSGYTGLHAAIQTARGGRSTLVLEAGDPGWGCSSRNGGHVSTSIKPSTAALTRIHGTDRAKAMRAEGRASLDWIEDFINAEGIACSFRRAGRFHAAHTPKHYEGLARTADTLRRDEAVDVFEVPRFEQGREIGSSFYHGGLVYPRFATLHPAEYHRGLLDMALAAGAAVVPHCAALAIDGTAGRFEVKTSLGTVQARDVVVATNGYTQALTPWLQRRVIPIGSYVIATEALDPAEIDACFPTGRIVCDTRKVVYYYGPTPCGTRVVFGGRVSSGETDPRVSGPRLHAELTRLFPQLARARIAHSWSGTVAYTFDTLPHCGRHEGIHYAMGYCGAGVAMAGYLGMRMGQRVLGLAEGATAFDDLPFPTRPLYSGKPWFLPAAVAFYRWRDALECRLAARGAPPMPAAPAKMRAPS